MSARRGAAGLGAATVLALTAGCGMLGIGGEEEASQEERLVEMLNQSNRIESEVQAAESRIVQNCLEAAGHTVHEPWEMQVYEPGEQETLTYYYPHEGFLLDAETASQFGFGGWANSPDVDSQEAEDYWAAEEEKYEEEEGDENWEEPDTTEWDALPPEEQYSWYVAYQGEEYAEEYYGSEQDYVDMMSGEDDYTEGELTDEELAALEEEAAAEEDGEIVVEGEESYEAPKPGGCQLEMIEALYGEPRMVEYTYEEDGGESYTEKYWEYRPKNPASSEGEEEGEDMYSRIEAEYTAAMADLQGQFLDCIADLGHEGWEFDEWNGLPTWQFLDALYFQNSTDEDRGIYADGGDETEIPELPDDAGSTYEEWKAYEIKMAVDFSKCGEDIGYADASEKAYDEAHIEAYAAIEEDVYAWQQEMKDIITKAQEMLDA
jgi:hypothetical protein